MAIGIKFEDKIKSRITVANLNNGEVFIYENFPYMLITNGNRYNEYFYISKDDGECGTQECDYIAVSLLNGTLKDFNGSECVSLITKDLEIKIDKEDISEWM